MDAKQRKKEEELIRVSERAKEIDFGTLGVAARSTASAPIEPARTNPLGDTSAFEESGSAWVADDQGGLSISWTGKTASALIGVTGLKRAFAAAAVVTARDDLQTIKGVGPFIEKLNALGITTFRQVANMTPGSRTRSTRPSSSSRAGSAGTSGRSRLRISITDATVSGNRLPFPPDLPVL